MTYAGYVAFEGRTPGRHEYLDGRVLAMAGGTPEHGALAAAVTGMLFAQLASQPCHVLTSDVRVKIQETGLTTYPDVSVVCGPAERDTEDPIAITNPTALVEILSERTEAYDRGEKFAHYRRLLSLREYVLVAQDAPRIEVFRRDATGNWSLHEFRPGDRARLESIGCALDVTELYERAALR